MAGMLDYFGRILFHIKWFFWTPTQKYAYLWNRTLNG
jgi:hypothetical protein